MRLDVGRFRAEAQAFVDLIDEVVADDMAIIAGDEVNPVHVIQVVLFTDGMGIFEGYARCTDGDKNYGMKALVGQDGLEDVEPINYWEVGQMRHKGLARLVYNVLDSEVRHGWQAD